MNVTITDSTDEFITTAPSNEPRAFQYPLTVQDEEDRHSSYLVFYAVQAQGGGLKNSSLDKRSLDSVSGKFKEETLCTIQLYMPAMNEQVQHNYDQNDGGFLQDMMVNMSAKPGADKSGLIASATRTAVDRLAVQAGSVGQQFNAQVSGQVLGSRSAAMYKSSQPRQQTFRFQLRPRNLAELKQVGYIMRAFLVYSAATHGGHVSLQDVIGEEWSSYAGDYANGGEGFSVVNVPPLWFCEERVKKGQVTNRYTPKFAFGPAAVTSVRFDKTPDQVTATFNRTSGDPIAVDMEITLTELRPQFAEYYKRLTKNLGQQDTGEFEFKSFL